MAKMTAVSIDKCSLPSLPRKFGAGIAGALKNEGGMVSEGKVGASPEVVTALCEGGMEVVVDSVGTVGRASPGAVARNSVPWLCVLISTITMLPY
jgi:hypothetical protein